MHRNFKPISGKLFSSRRVVALAATAIVTSVVVGQLRADTSATWTGANVSSNDYWLNSANWAGGVVPNNGSPTGSVYDVTIPSTGTSPNADLSSISPTIGQLITQTGTDLYNSNGAGGGAETLFIDPSTMTVQSGSTIAGAVSDTSTGLLTLNFGNGNTSSVTSTITGAMSGNVALVVDQSTGTVVLSGANTYTGGTTISAGTLSISSAGNLGTGGLTLVGGTLETTAGITVGNAVTISSNSVINTDSNSDTFSGVFSGSGTLNVIGGGVLTLSGNNSGDSGGFYVSGATLSVSAADNLGTGGLVLNNGTLETTAGITVSQGISLNNGGGTINTDSQNDTISGIISGAGNLTVTGGGTLTLSGANTYTGTTTISAGTLTFIGDTSGLTGNVIDNAALVYNQTANSSVSGVISGSGSLTQAGSAKLTLTGANTYSGATTISSGTLALSGSGSIAGSSGVTDNGTLDISNTTSGATINDLSGSGTVILGSKTLTVDVASGVSTPVFAGIMSGTGGLTFGGGGYFELTGANTYTGLTNITAGTLLDGSANSLADTTVNVGGGGRLQMNTSTATIGGLTGSGTVILPISSLTVNVASGTDLFSGQLDEIGFGNFTLNKTGAGTLELSGNNFNFSGLTTISAGTLIAANNTALGQLGSPGSGVALSGGTLETPLVASGGTSGSNITLTVPGNYTQTAGGTLGLALTTSGSFDSLQVQGSATLAGTLDALVQAGAKPAAGTQAHYNVIVTSGGVTGGFSSLALATGSVTGVSLSGAISGNDYVLTLSNGFNFAITGANLTPNQLAVANCFNTVGNTFTLSGPTLTLLQTISALPAGELGAALNQIAPLAYTNVPATLINNSIFNAQALNGQISGQFAGSGFNTSGLMLLKTTNTDPFSLALDSALQSNSKVNAQTSSTQYMDDVMQPTQGNVPLPSRETAHDSFGGFIAGQAILGSQPTSTSGQNYFTGGINSGLDYRFAKSLLVGISFDYSYTNAHIDGVGSVLTDNSYAPGLFAGYRKNNFYVNASADYDYSQFHIHRNVSIGGLSSTASGKPSTNEQDVNTLAGYNFPLFAHFKAGPAIGLDYSHISVSSYTETGSAADLSVSRYSIDSLRSLLGGQADYKLMIPKVPTPLTITANAFWQHEYLNNSHGITAALAGAGSGSFITNVANPGRDSALLGAGISGKVCRYATLFANYEAQIGPKDQHSQSIMVGMAVNF